MKVSEQFIANVLSKIDLVELISKKVHLRRVGANFIGLCPFHQENTPSFTVNPIKQFFYCFGCKKSGDAISFLIEKEQKTFIDALTILSNQVGLSLSSDAEYTVNNPLIDKVYKILDQAAYFYHQTLLNENSSVAKTARDYLHNRGISIDIVRRYKLGVADTGWTNIYDLLVKQYSDVSLLQHTGLFVEKNGKFYDRFRTRIIFPIINKFGKTIGFGARALAVEQTPKYLNSPESMVFKKNQELYGLYHAKNDSKNFNTAIVVEGYLDVLTLTQAGISNVVATLGTAVNENHLRSLLYMVSEIVFCFDGDVAGYQATVKAMILCINMMSQGIIKSKHILKFVLLPDNYDPDLLVKEQGTTALLYYLEKAKLLSDFFFDYLDRKYPEKSIENLNQLAQEAKSHIDKFNDHVLKKLWYQKLSKLLGIEYNEIENNNVNTKYVSVANMKKDQKKQRIYPISNAYRVIAMLVSDPKLVKFCNILINDRFANLKLAVDLTLLIKVIKLLQRSQTLLYNNNDTMHYLTCNLEPVYAQKLLLLDINKIVPLIINISKEEIEQEFIGAVKKINKELIEKLVEELLMLAKSRTLETQEKLLLQQMLSELYIKI